MINLDWTLFLQFANFLVLLFLLNLLLYRPLSRIMEERDQTVQGGHQRAKDLENQIEAKMAAYREKLQSAKSKAAEERNALRAAAAEEEARILGDAQAKAADQVKTVRNKVASQAQEARENLRGQAEELATRVASKVLGRSL